MIDMNTNINSNILMFKKFVYSMMLKNKIKDVKTVYDYGYKLNLSDSDISMVLAELGF